MSTVRLQKELSYSEALEVLGFKPGTLVSPHLPAFRQVESKLCQLIEATRDEEVKSNFRAELGRLNEALRVLEAGKDYEPPVVAKGMGWRLAASLILVACVVGAFWYGNQILLKDRETNRDRQVESLAVEGRIAMENRRWDEAEVIYAKIESLVPGSPRARDGFRIIEEGKDAEQRQNLGFLLGSARSAIELRQWDEAEERAKEALAMEPDNQEALAFVPVIEEGRINDNITRLMEGIERSRQDENWEELARFTTELERMAPTHPELPALRVRSDEGLRMLEARRIQARELYELALKLDNGEYSQEGLDALREAIRLADHPDFQVLYKKMSGYNRLLEVPADFATITEALQAARENDKIMVAAGVYEESLVFDRKLDLEGAGPDQTIVQCKATVSSVLQAAKTATGSRVAGMTFRHDGIALSDERYPVVGVDGTELQVENCTIENGAGHGIAVVNGGLGRLQRVRVIGCGWDGLAVYGGESRAVVSDSRFESNFQQGVDAWGGGSVEIRKSRCTENGLSGVVLMSRAAKSVLTQCVMDRNREVGVVISNGTRAELRSNRAEANLLGGYLVEGEGTEVILERNVAEKNGKVGIMVDNRSNVTSFAENVSQGNLGEQIKLQAEIPVETLPPPPAIDPPRAIPVETSGETSP